MNRTCKTCIVLALLSLYALPVRCDDPAAGPKWAIRGGKIDTITKGNLEGAVVLVSGGLIEKVIPSPGDDWKLPAGYKLIDAGERWVVPGFIELHSYLSIKNTLLKPQYITLDYRIKITPPHYNQSDRHRMPSF